METLGSKDDKMWPIGSWPRMVLKDGLKIGSKGGHGPIKYEVKEYNPGKSIKFEFKEPKGFNGFHQFEMESVSSSQTRLIHTIKMNTSLLGYLQWIIAIRWLHDALIEDAFDKIQNSLTNSRKKSRWNWYVRQLRKLLE